MPGYIFTILTSILAITVVAETIHPNIYKSFTQHDYHVVFRRMAVISSNKHLIDILNITTFKFNRTCAAVNMLARFQIDTSEELQVIVQAYKFVSNEYRMFPIHFQVNWCKAFEANFIGVQDALKCGNYKGCPIEKGKLYHVCNWTLDETKLPPGIPTGKYKAELAIQYYSEEVLTVYLELDVVNALYIF